MVMVIDDAFDVKDGESRRRCGVLLKVGAEY
jgi:hypothetical protein